MPPERRTIQDPPSAPIDTLAMGLIGALTIGMGLLAAIVIVADA